MGARVSEIEEAMFVCPGDGVWKSSEIPVPV
jgi:hypothetical protein